MASPLRDLSYGRSWSWSRFRALRYRAKISFAVGGFMGLADLRPFPIPLFVRYKLIDSCSLAGPVPACPVCRGYYRSARALTRERFKSTKGKKGREKKTKEEKTKSKWQTREAVLYCAVRRNETEFMPRRAGRGTYSSFELATLLHFARSRRTN